MVTNFLIDQPALLEINRKIATMGGGDYHLGKKGPLFAALCLLSVCFWVFAIPARKKKKEKGAHQKKNMEGTNGPDPLAARRWWWQRGGRVVAAGSAAAGQRQ